MEYLLQLTVLLLTLLSPCMPDGISSGRDFGHFNLLSFHLSYHLELHALLKRKWIRKRRGNQVKTHISYQYFILHRHTFHNSHSAIPLRWRTKRDPQHYWPYLFWLRRGTRCHPYV